MLLKHLLYDYERQNRPVLNETEPLVLTFGITLQQIIDVVSETEQRFKREKGTSIYLFISIKTCTH